MTEKKIVLLNGPSSSGKSTLAGALQSLIAERRNTVFPVVSIDDFMKISTQEKIYEEDVYEISGDMCESARRALRTSEGVIIDHVITSERIYAQLKAALNPYPVFSVHVCCPLDILLKREAERGDRHRGSAQSSYEYLYPKDGYDLTVDTGSLPPPACCEAVFEALFLPSGAERKTEVTD